MSNVRANSSPDLMPPSNLNRQDDQTGEGLTANVKLLLKLVQEHSNSSNQDDGPEKNQQVAGIVRLIDGLKSRFAPTLQKQREAELRRSLTNPRPTHVPKEKNTNDEFYKLRKELSASLAARKSLEKMFSSLGKEKEIIAAELARKVQEMNGMEEHLNDLKAQNEKLLAKVQACKTEHRDKRGGVVGGATGSDGNSKSSLQQRNEELSGQLLKSLSGYKSMKRKLKDALEDNAAIRARMAEMEEEIAAGLDRIQIFRQKNDGQRMDFGEIEEQLMALERTLQLSDAKVISKPPVDMHIGKPSIVA